MPIVNENTIFRNEILKLLGISLYAYQNLQKRKNFKIPHKIGKYRNNYLFERKKIYEWLDTKPLENIDKPESDIDKLILSDYKEFVGGLFDRPDLRDQYTQAMLYARKSKPMTTTVHLKRDFCK